MPLALGLEAASAPARERYASAIPVLAFCLGVFIVSVGAWRSDRRGLTRRFLEGDDDGRR